MDNSPMPLVTIITPSFNQAAFIRDTIESVLTQDYPHIEHLVIDGGSTDGTLAILKHYSNSNPRFRYISEPDRGQSHAINKGLKMARGQIIGWLNSDDTYFPKAVQKAVKALHDHPNWAMVYGQGIHINAKNKFLYKYPSVPFDRKKMFHHCIICQPTVFLRKEVFEAVGGVDEELHYCMDYDLWLRISNSYTIGYIEDYLANSRLHDGCKSVKSVIDTGFPEIMATSFKHFGTVANEWVTYFLRSFPEKGALWFLEQFKRHQFFGKSPSITSLNLLPDKWAPPYLRLSVEIDPQYPLHTLLIKGSQPISSHPLHFHIMVDGSPIPFSSSGTHSFELEIPIHAAGPSCFIDVICSRQFCKEDPSDPANKQMVSFLAEQIVALTEDEYSFYQAFHRGGPSLVDWMKRYRNPSPSL